MTDPTAGMNCHLCGGVTVKGMVLDHDYEADYPASFIIEGDTQGLVHMSFPNPLTIIVRACIACGHLSNFVARDQLRARLQEMGRLDDLTGEREPKV